jgi:hypothetical protein
MLPVQHAEGKVGSVNVNVTEKGEQLTEVGLPAAMASRQDAPCKAHIPEGSQMRARLAIIFGQDGKENDPPTFCHAEGFEFC